MSNRLKVAVEKTAKNEVVPIQFTAQIHTVEVDAEKAAALRKYGRLSRALRRTEAVLKDCKLGLALPEVGKGEKFRFISPGGEVIAEWSGSYVAPFQSGDYVRQTLKVRD